MNLKEILFQTKKIFLNIFFLLKINRFNQVNKPQVLIFIQNTLSMKANKLCKKSKSKPKKPIWSRKTNNKNSKYLLISLRIKKMISKAKNRNLNFKIVMRKIRIMTNRS